MTKILIDEKWMDKVLADNELLERALRDLVRVSNDFDGDTEALVEEVEVVATQALRKVAPPGVNRSVFASEKLWSEDDLENA